jgi:DNA-binding NarL/FixJ family response regulator
MRRLTKLRVVIADDEASLRTLLRLVLARDGRFDVVGEAADGAQAVEQVRALDPDVLLLDLGMPVLDGLQVLETLAGTGAPPRTVVLTGFIDPGTQRLAHDLGAAACLVKGPGFEELCDVLVGTGREVGA